MAAERVTRLARSLTEGQRAAVLLLEEKYWLPFGQAAPVRCLAKNATRDLYEVAGASVQLTELGFRVAKVLREMGPDKAAEAQDR